MNGINNCLTGIQQLGYQFARCIRSICTRIQQVFCSCCFKRSQSDPEPLLTRSVETLSDSELNNSESPTQRTRRASGEALVLSTPTEPAVPERYINHTPTEPVPERYINQIEVDNINQIEVDNVRKLIGALPKKLTFEKIQEIHLLKKDLFLSFDPEIQKMRQALEARPIEEVRNELNEVIGKIDNEMDLESLFILIDDSVFKAAYSKDQGKPVKTEPTALQTMIYQSIKSKAKDLFLDDKFMWNALLVDVALRTSTYAELTAHARLLSVTELIGLTPKEQLEYMRSPSYSNNSLIKATYVSDNNSYTLVESANGFAFSIQPRFSYHQTIEDHVSTGKNALIVLEERINAGSINVKEVCEKVQKLYDYQKSRVVDPPVKDYYQTDLRAIVFWLNRH